MTTTTSPYTTTNPTNEANPLLSEPSRSEITGDDGTKRQPWHSMSVGLLLLLLLIATFVVVEVARRNPRQTKKLAVYPYAFISPSNDASNWIAPGGYRYQEYADGSSPYRITKEIRQQSDELARIRREHVKAAMQFAWKGYTTYAFGMDEIKPVSKVGDNVWKGLATTMVDALDTLWLMNMTEEFSQARDFVAQNLTYADKNVSIICFETTIRSLGGMLSAYSWSGDAIFLEHALDIGRRIFHSFDGASTGIPFGRVNLMTGEFYNDHHDNFTPLSWVGTLQLEFRCLDALVQSNETANMRQKVENIIAVLYSLNPPRGLYPTLVRNVNVSHAEFANTHLTFGANGDSFYEYLLKAWLQGNKTEVLYRNMYDQAIQSLHDILLQESTPSGLIYLVDESDGVKIHKLHHLTCFMGGLLSLGAYTDPLGMQSFRAQRDLKTAKALTYTCYQMYARQKTGRLLESTTLLSDITNRNLPSDAFWSSPFQSLLTSDTLSFSF